jgi:hypothetical protein
VWTEEYLHYRVNRCGRTAATGRVLPQSDGGGGRRGLTSCAPFPYLGRPGSLGTRLAAAE